MFKIKGTSYRTAYDKKYIQDGQGTYLLHYAEHGDGGMYELYESVTTCWGTEGLTLSCTISYMEIDSCIAAGLWKIFDEKPIEDEQKRKETD